MAVEADLNNAPTPAPDNESDVKTKPDEVPLPVLTAELTLRELDRVDLVPVGAIVRLPDESVVKAV